MPILLTASEQARLEWIIAAMNRIRRAARARERSQIEQRVTKDMARIEAEAPELIDDGVVENLWWFSADLDERREFDKLTAEHNKIVVRGKQRHKEQRDTQAAEVERAQMRAARCDDCFMIHRPGQKDCD